MEDEHGNVVRGNTHSVTGDGPYSVSFPLEHKVKNHGKLNTDVVFGETGIRLLEGMLILSELQDFSKLAVRIVDVLESI